MTDDKSKPGGQDRTRINVHEEYEVRDWSKRFGISTDELRAAVRAVGPHAATVEHHLRGVEKK
jgi:hypothetical protein